MEETLKRKARGDAFKEEKRSESNHSDEDRKDDEDMPLVKDNELDSAKAEMHEVREENQRLRTYLDKMVKDYQSLQTQFNNIVHDRDSPNKSASNYRALSDQEHREGKHERPEFADVSLGLGRSSSGELKRDNDNKHSSSPKRGEASTKIVEQDREEGLRLGLDCRFDMQPSVLSKEGLPESSPEHSLDDAKEVDAEKWPPQKSEKSAEGDEVSHQNPAKKARVSVRVRCDTPTMIDGCQWRKYGQKIAKGNPCPRAYYRCSVTPSCPVRKQVQRCSQDMSILITTYEGTHNHTLPIAAHAMASTTSAAAGMILSGSSTSGVGSSGTSTMTTPAELHGLNYYLSNNSTSSRPPFYLPNTSISSSSSYPSITLDLTSGSSSMSSNFPPRYNVNSSSTNLNFNTSMESNSTLPIFWSNGNNYQLQNYAKNTQMGPSLNFGRQHQENFYPYSYMQKNNNDVPQAHQPMQMDKSSIESATKAITSDPNFQSALAAAITSMIGSNNNNSSGNGQNVKLEQSFPVLSSFLSTNSQAASNMRPLPPLPISSSKSKSTSPEDNRDQVR